MLRSSIRLAVAVGVVVFGLAGGALANGAPGNVSFSPITDFPKEFPRFYTPITGTVMTTTAPEPEPVGFCLPNTDRSQSVLVPSAELTLFGWTEDVGSWGALGSAHVTDDGSEICTDEGVGPVESGLYVVAVRTSDIATGIPDIVADLGDASPLEPSGLFCNRLTEFACRRTCGTVYLTRLSVCSATFFACQFDCGDRSVFLRPACRALCTSRSLLCSREARVNRRQCRDRCDCG